MAKKNNTSNLISAILYILVGVLLIVFKSATLGWAMTIAGVIFIISGVIDLIKKNWMGGAVSLIIGISILVLGWTATKIVLLVLGILIAIGVTMLNTFPEQWMCWAVFAAFCLISMGVMLGMVKWLERVTNA